MANLTSVNFLAGVVSTTTTGTVSTLDNLLGTAGSASANVLSVQTTTGGNVALEGGGNLASIATKLSSNVSVLTSTGGIVANAANQTTFLATLGTSSGAAVTSDAAGTVQQYLRGLVAQNAAGISVSVSNQNANGRAVPASSSPVVLASQKYQAVAASASSTGLSGGSGGAAGDWLDGFLVNPATTTPGNVTIIDSTTTIMTFAFGTLADTRPFYVPWGATSATSGWKVTTGSNVSILATGNFT